MGGFIGLIFFADGEVVCHLGIWICIGREV